MKTYAQTNANGIVTAIVETSGEIPVTATIIDADGHAPELGQQWDGAQFVPVLPTQAETAKADLAKIDRDTGMARTMRETLIAIGEKVGANVAYLKAKETEAGTLRGKL